MTSCCALLRRLSNSQGNLLDDTQLIDVLAVTKQTAQDVSDKLANASETNNKINEACEEYRPVAHRATLIYFLIAEFSVVNCMYQTSLAQFNELYEKSIDASEKASMPSKRIANIIEHMTYEIYLYIQVRDLCVLGCWPASSPEAAAQRTYQHTCPISNPADDHKLVCICDGCSVDCLSATSSCLR